MNNRFSRVNAPSSVNTIQITYVLVVASKVESKGARKP